MDDSHIDKKCAEARVAARFFDFLPRCWKQGIIPAVPPPRPQAIRASYLAHFLRHGDYENRVLTKKGGHGDVLDSTSKKERHVRLPWFWCMGYYQEEAQAFPGMHYSSLLPVSVNRSLADLYLNNI